MKTGFWLRTDKGRLLATGRVDVKFEIRTGEDAYEAAARLGNAVELAILDVMGIGLPPIETGDGEDIDQLRLEFEPSAALLLREARGRA